MDTRAKFQDIPERIAGLTELAYNFWWSWNNEARMLFKMLDRYGWKLSVHNPVKMLYNIDKNILNKLLKTKNFSDITMR